MKNKIVLYYRHLNAKGRTTPVDNLGLDCFRLSQGQFWYANMVLYKHKNRLKVLKKRK